jgi:hypothetical protein
MFMLSFKSLKSKDHQPQHRVALNLTLTETCVHMMLQDPFFVINGISLQHLTSLAGLTVLVANFIQHVSHLATSLVLVLYFQVYKLQKI